MAYPMDPATYISRLKVTSPGIKALEAYKRTDQLLKHQCRRCKHIWKSTPQNMLHKTNPTGCPRCAHPSIKKTHADYVNEVAFRTNGAFKVLSRYINALTKVRVKCGAGHVSDIWPRSIGRCAECHKINANKRYRLGITEYKKRLRAKFPSIKVISGKYIKQESVLGFQCRDGHIFSRSAIGQISKSPSVSGCPVCDKSINQSGVALDFMNALAKLSRLAIHHARNSGEYQLEGTRYKLDGYNPRYNIGLEFHGDYFHGNDGRKGGAYEKTLLRDQEVRKYVNLIVVWEYEWRNNKDACLQRCLRRINKIRQSATTI